MINRNKKIAMSVVRAILLAIFLIAALLPLYWIFVTSIKAGTEIYTLSQALTATGSSSASVILACTSGTLFL